MKNTVDFLSGHRYSIPTMKTSSTVELIVAKNDHFVGPRIQVIKKGRSYVICGQHKDAILVVTAAGGLFGWIKKTEF